VGQLNLDTLPRVRLVELRRLSTTEIIISAIEFRTIILWQNKLNGGAIKSSTYLKIGYKESMQSPIGTTDFVATKDIKMAKSYSSHTVITGFTVFMKIRQTPDTMACHYHLSMYSVFFLSELVKKWKKKEDLKHLITLDARAQNKQPQILPIMEMAFSQSLVWSSATTNDHWNGLPGPQKKGTFCRATTTNLLKLGGRSKHKQ